MATEDTYIRLVNSIDFAAPYDSTDMSDDLDHDPILLALGELPSSDERIRLAHDLAGRLASRVARNANAPEQHRLTERQIARRIDDIRSILQKTI